MSNLCAIRVPKSGNVHEICAGAIGLLLLLPASLCWSQNTAMTPQPGAAVSSTAAPATADILPSESLGADDLLEIMVSYCPELSRTFRVGSDGTLALPLLSKRLAVTGLTPSEVGQKLSQALVEEHIMADPTVNVSVLEYRSRPVSVVGAVNKPLTFQATGQTSLLDAIARAGGLSPTAGGTVIVTDNHKTHEGSADLESNVKMIPVKDLFATGDPKYNLKLVGGEEIRVPEASKIFVGGDVKKPGMYLMQSDAQTTVMKAIDLSGGLDSFSAHIAYICRHDPAGGECKQIEVPLKDIMTRKAPDMAMNADDVLFVPTSNGKKVTARVLNELAGFSTSAAAGLVIYH